MSISGTNEATQSVPFGTPVDTGNANASGSAATAARSDHVHKGVVANEAWTAYTPTFLNLTKGDGTVAGAYTRIGRTISFRVYILLGSTSAVGSAVVSVSMPVASASAEALGACSATYLEDGAIPISGSTLPVSTSFVGLVETAGWVDTDGPFTWGTGDEIWISGTYEAAS